MNAKNGVIKDLKSLVENRKSKLNEVKKELYFYGKGYWEEHDKLDAPIKAFIGTMNSRRLTMSELNEWEELQKKRDKLDEKYFKSCTIKKQEKLEEKSSLIEHEIKLLEILISNLERNRIGMYCESDFIWNNCD